VSCHVSNPEGKPAGAHPSPAGFLEALPFASAGSNSPFPAHAPISATILTKNSAALLRDVLTALEWCDEVVVLDTGSTDATLAIAAQFANVSLHQLDQPFPGFGRAHRQAVVLARHDWILSIDSDEIVSPALRDEIRALALDPATVYVVPFENYFNGKHITTCGWAPDRHERLFNRSVTNFCMSEVHERVGTVDLTVAHLREPIRHYSYRSMQDFLRKMSTYSELFATQNAGRKRSNPAKAVARSLWAFFKSYVLERGVLDGTEGLVISAYKAQTVFWKYLRLHEANARLAERQTQDIQTSWSPLTT
jgi:glycosyltransferase involved in cell wall biosynthesis